MNPRGGYFDDEEFCFALDDVCEAYPALGTPAQRLMWDPKRDPRLHVFALAFDMRVRSVSSLYKAKLIKGVETESESKREHDEWMKNASPEEIEALHELIGV